MNNEFADMVDNKVITSRCPQINSVLIYKDEQIVLERYYNGFNQDSRHAIKSIWKSILSICTGIALDKGIIKTLDEPIGNYLAEFSGSNHPYHRLITIRHLLTMTSGIYWNGGVHYHCPMLEQLFRASDPIGQLADTAMSDIPGSRHIYKEWDVILLSALLGRAIGGSVFGFCRNNLYTPLDIKSDRWASFKDGTEYSLSKDPALEAQSNLSARALASIGLLFLNGGQGIISQSYIKEATTRSACSEGYGYLWWIVENGYRCSGFGGQQIRVIPEHSIVYVVQATALARHREYDDVIKEVIDSLCIT